MPNTIGLRVHFLAVFCYCFFNMYVLKSLFGIDKIKKWVNFAEQNPFWAARAARIAYVKYAMRYTVGVTDQYKLRPPERIGKRTRRAGVKVRGESLNAERTGTPPYILEGRRYRDA